MEKLRNILIKVSTKKYYITFLVLALLNNVIFSDILPFVLVKTVSLVFIAIALVLSVFAKNIDDVKNRMKLSHIIFTDCLFWDLSIYLVLLNIMFLFRLNILFIIVFYIVSEILSVKFAEFFKKKL